MRPLAVPSRRRRTVALSAVVLAGLVVGLHSGISLASRGPELTSTDRSLGRSGESTITPRTDSREGRPDTVPTSDVLVANIRNLPRRHGGRRADPGLIPVEPGTTRPTPSLASAGRFFLTELGRKTSGDWARSWQNLYPLHRQVAPRDTFIRCETATSFAAPLESARVVRVRAAPVRVPGMHRPVPGAAVTIAVRLTWYGPRDPIRFTYTFHLVPVANRWTWLLSRERYRLYLRDACLVAPAS